VPLCAGLNLINVSLDTLRADRFERMTRRRGHERVLETIQQAVDFGYDPVKVGHLLVNKSDCSEQGRVAASIPRAIADVSQGCMVRSNCDCFICGLQECT
jgi:hypothetical protein